MTPVVFTARSTGIGVTTGVLVAAALGQVLGVSWGLATLTGWGAGAGERATSAWATASNHAALGRQQLRHGR